MAKLYQKIIIFSLALFFVCIFALSIPFSYAKDKDKKIITVSSKYSGINKGISPYTAYNYPFYLAKLDSTSKGKNNWNDINIKYYNHNVADTINNDLDSYKQKTGLESLIVLNSEDNFLEKVEFFANTKPNNLGKKIKNFPITDETDLFFANVGAKISF